jgi:RimJ/RimL family protein N-acetyltransferase
MIPVLETERLVLREWRLDDFPAYAAYWADAEASAQTGGPLDERGAWTQFTANIGHWPMRGYGMWMLAEKQSGRPVGHAGMWYPATWPEPEIGWVVFPAFRRLGYAFEAAEAALDHAKKALGWTTAMSFIRDTNMASRALAEKLGARLEKSLEFRGVTALIYRHDPQRFN